MRWLRGLLALLTIVVVVGGAPALLIGWGRLVGPAGWRGDDGSLLLALLTVAGWLAWLAFTLATAAEVVRFASGNRFVVDLPLLGGLQALCAGLVLAVVGLGVATPGPTGLAPSPPVADPAALFPATLPQPDRSPDDITATTGAEARSDQGRAGAPTRVARPRYDVAPGDDLWSIAERVLGDGRRWRELKQANPDVLADPTRQLAAGTTLALPDPPEPERITVVRGDTLSDLAEKHLGKARLWPRIAAANADLIEDPDHIEVGWVLELPEERSGRARAKPAGEEPKPAAEPDERKREPREPRPADELPPHPGPSPSVPADPAPTVAPADAPPDESDDQSSAAAPQSDAVLLGGLSAMAAAGLMGAWQARRLLQARVRRPGRRVAHPSDDLARFHSALGRRQVPDRTVALDAALRAIGRYHHRLGKPLPGLAQVTLTHDRLLFQWAEPADQPPLGFTGDRTAWVVEFDQPAPAPPVTDQQPCPYPALVSLGTAPDGETVMVDVERTGVLGVAADTRELQVASLASLAVELGCAPWAAELCLVVVGPEGALARTAGGEAVVWLADAEAALARLRRRHRERSRELAGSDLRILRTDPERADAVAPEVYVFHEPLPSDLQDELDELLSGSGLGLAAVVCAPEGEPASWTLFGDPVQPSGRLADAPVLAAHTVAEPTRAAVRALYEVADSDRTERAPWWADDADPSPSRAHPSEDDVEIVSLRPRQRPHPTLMLLGPVDLTGAAGPEPTRARNQLIELASWILEHPGRTATQMAAGLGIAETTRRSNLSRLRSWLGADPEGEPYLPDAYSGRIKLHPDVSSDLGLLRLLTGPGVNRVGEHGLVAALELVRGGILADAAPGQWFWAEQLRSDAAAVLRDAALVLVDRALGRRDVDLARWATERALWVCPEDELLVCARIRTEQAAGNRAAVERYVLRLSQQARTLGVDLLPETVMLCQQVMEGRPRARRA